MSEFPSKKKADYLSTLMLSNFIFFSSFIISHPLYFAYFIFFSPYLFKILSFLSPLFATTSLLLLAIFTLTPSILLHGSPNFQLPKSNPSLLLSTYQDDFSCFQILQAFQLALDVEIIPVEEEEEIPQGEDHRKVPEVKQVKNLVAFFQEKEKLSGKKQVKATNTVTDKGQEFVVRGGSKALEGDEPPTFITPISTDDPRSRLRSASSWGSENGDGKQRLNNKLKEKNFSQPLESYVGTSLRRGEKEWRRTLACKLFEERNHGVDGAEGMDLLWETYETETAAKKKKPPSPSPSPSPSSHFRNGSKKKGKNSRGTSYSVSIDEEEEESDGPLCCLQAFKLSAGKMNLGMGRPGIVKITKALKGFGWLHHNVVASASPRRTKKSYHHSI